MSGDTARDELSGDGRWMTYGELATARGIDRQSAVKLVRRQHWRRQEGNNGTTRVFVPEDWSSRAKSRDAGPDETRDDARDISGFEAAVEALKAAHAVEIATLERTHQSALAVVREAHAGEVTALRESLDREQARADREGEGRAAERTRADSLRDRIEALQHDLDGVRQDAKDAAESVRQAEAERKARGRWTRLVAAWRRQ